MDRHLSDLAEIDASQLIELDGVGKSFGTTRANGDLSFVINKGDVIGLVGANGAGKSTLMRILAGIVQPDAGRMAFEGKIVDASRFSPGTARKLGIRIVHQELSLCDSLTVTENFYLEDPGKGGSATFWRRDYARLARRSIEQIFPESKIDVRASVDSLSIAQRQMVEIARAVSDPLAKLIILDEPTSSLDGRRSSELRNFVARRASEGVAFIFISHKLAEMKSIASRILIMRNGELVWQGATEDIELGRVVDLMAGGALGVPARMRSQSRSRGEVLVSMESGEFVEGARLDLCRGEIIGLAGLEGNGQRELLHAIGQASGQGRAVRSISCRGAVTFVSGDRVNEGIFPLWDVLENASVTALTHKSSLALLNRSGEADLVRRWLEKVSVDANRLGSFVTELSGGNQQKVLMARAFAAESDIILLDDPTRGVDVAVKADFYRLLREAAEDGKLIIWLSSEDSELLECDRVFVVHDGHVVSELVGADISEDAIVSAAFERHIAGVNARTAGRERSRRRINWTRYAPILTMAAVFIAVALLNSSAATLFGLDLLLSAAVPLVLVGIAQMFVVGGSEIDLGMGALAGLVNVVSATILVASLPLGIASLLGLILVYCLLGLLIRVRRIPAIVVTLGASFIWLGIGYVIQPSPGGSSPAWLGAILGGKLLGIPASIYVILLAGLAAWLINGSRIGTVLRGFGANARALEQAGWSPVRAYLWRYGISGIFTLLAGLSLTATNLGSDVNAGNSYTLLSIAAVVIGGCELGGGKILPVGVVCGAVTLSLIGSLLGFLNVSTDYNAAVQGSLLIGILLLKWRPQGRAQ